MSMNSVTIGKPNLETFVSQNLRKLNEKLRQRVAWRKVYSHTFQELKRLSDRDLADLGMTRVNLRQIATEAANDAIGEL